jgi:hypothetical protein
MRQRRKPERARVNLDVLSEEMAVDKFRRKDCGMLPTIPQYLSCGAACDFQPSRQAALRTATDYTSSVTLVA